MANIPKENNVHITEKIYGQVKKVISYNYEWLLFSKNKKPFYNGQAKGPNFSKIRLQDIVSLYENGFFEIEDKRLAKKEIISINNGEGINLRRMMKFQGMKVLSLKKKTHIPGILYSTENLKEAMVKNCWYKYELDKNIEYIYVDWYNSMGSHFPGTFHYSPRENYYTYRHGEYMVKTHKLHELMDLIGVQV